MSAGHQVPLKHSAGRSSRAESYADFITDADLMQAKADVEECYRRRARRAGLEGTLQVGRIMTEEEINDLSERLGDWGPASGFRSRGMKHSREVVAMTIEEMEAEIRETEEEKGSGATTDAASTLDVPGGDASRRIYCIRLLQPEQCGRVLLPPGARRVRQHGQGRGGGDDSVR
jgi:hypothetical protein